MEDSYTYDFILRTFITGLVCLVPGHLPLFPQQLAQKNRASGLEYQGTTDQKPTLELGKAQIRQYD